MNKYLSGPPVLSKTFAHQSTNRFLSRSQDMETFSKFQTSKVAYNCSILETNASGYTIRSSMLPTPLLLANYAGMRCCYFCIHRKHKRRVADESCITMALVPPFSHVQEANQFEGRSLVPATTPRVLGSCLESSGSGQTPAQGLNLDGTCSTASWGVGFSFNIQID
jgi:hypothetical protein